MTETKPRYGSSLEEYFAYLLTEAGIKFVAQYKAVPGRRYSWDFYIPSAELLVEIQGGTWAATGDNKRPSGHTTHAGLHRDYEKNNLAVMAGWRVLYFDAAMVRSGEALAVVMEALTPRLATAAEEMKDYYEGLADQAMESE